MKKYKVVRLSEEKINETLVKLFAEVDPDSLKKISAVLKRELKAEKDNEDYNSLVISSFIDKTALPLMNVGQTSLKNGDCLKLDEDINNKLFEKKEDSFSNIEQLNNYSKYPFTWKVSQELRNYFILKTSKDDNYESLMDEADGLISKYMSLNDWIKLRSIVKKSEERLRVSTYQMLEPEYFVGEQRQLTNTEIAKYQLLSLDRIASVDVREDAPDLLALKEFISLLKGEKVHPLTIGPGFFAKMMPEMKQAGYSGLVFKIEKDTLKEIRLVKLKDVEVEYSPIASAQIMVQEYCQQSKKNIFGRNKNYFTDENTWTDSKYFVVVDGCVSSPSSMQLGYENNSLNDTKVPSGEVYIYEQVDGEILSTRAYFVPYDYSKLHLFHQHGSVVFGNNDQSLHSCILNEDAYFDYTYRDFIVDKVFNGKDDEDDYILFKPAFVACLLNVLKSPTDHKNLLEPQNYEAFLNSMACLYENNDLSMDYLTNKFVVSVDKDSVELVKKLTKNYAPLTQRFLLGEYLAQKSGLTKEELEVTYKKLAAIMKQKWLVNLYHKFSDMKLKL